MTLGKKKEQTDYSFCAMLPSLSDHRLLFFCDGILDQIKSLKCTGHFNDFLVFYLVGNITFLNM